MSRLRCLRRLTNFETTNAQAWPGLAWGLLRSFLNQSDSFGLFESRGSPGRASGCEISGSVFRKERNDPQGKPGKPGAFEKRLVWPPEPTDRILSTRFLKDFSPPPTGKEL